MTELTFLIDLLLNHKLQKPTRDAIAARLKEVETNLSARAPLTTAQVDLARLKSAPLPPHIASQSPSMQAIMLRNPDLAQGTFEAVALETIAAAKGAAEPRTVAIIAQTPAAAAAMASRQQAIRTSISGKPEKGLTSPRKF